MSRRGRAYPADLDEGVHHFSMRVLVSDTSILIDLERADLLRAAFSLDAEFVVPDLLYERELRNSGGADLLALGLRVESLDESEVERAQACRREYPRLALPDTFAYQPVESQMRDQGGARWGGPIQHPSGERSELPTALRAHSRSSRARASNSPPATPRRDAQAACHS